MHGNSTDTLNINIKHGAFELIPEKQNINLIKVGIFLVFLQQSREVGQIEPQSVATEPRSFNDNINSNRNSNNQSHTQTIRH